MTDAASTVAILLAALGTEGMRYLWIVSQLDWDAAFQAAGLGLAAAVAVRGLRRRAS